jgi:YVTN family beta-propeller protein
MASRESSRRRPAWADRRVIVAGAAAVVLAAAGTATALAVQHSPAGKTPAVRTRLAASSCTGPAGAAYIALPGYQAFDAVNTKNCDLIQQYNVGDGLVPNTGTEDFNYDSTDEGVAMHGDILYFADTGNDTVAVLDTAKLNPDNYENPAETLIHVGFDPENVAVTPNGKQVWATDTGPETGQPTLGGISVISTATKKVTGTIQLSTDPRVIAFSPSGATAYVTSQNGLLVIDTATLRVVHVVQALGNPEGVAVAPDGTVYVANTAHDRVDVISATTDRVTRTIQVGELPWQLAISSNGSTIYVANGDSDSISVVSTASDSVKHTISDSGDPVSVALTPDGSELWVGGLTSGIETVFDTSNYSLVGSFNVGYGGAPNSGDGEEPTGVVITTTPTNGSTAALQGQSQSHPRQ